MTNLGSRVPGPGCGSSPAVEASPCLRSGILGTCPHGCPGAAPSTRPDRGRCPRDLSSRLVPLGLIVLLLWSACAALAQYPTAKPTAKKSTNPRAVAILEWVGEPGKPSASRLIPVSIFIDGALQDGGLYMARPVPMTLESGTVYELQKAGKPVGLFDVGSAGHLQNGQFPNSWLGYGAWKPLPKPSPPRRIQTASTAHVIQDSNSDRPTFARKAAESGGAQPSSSPSPPNPAPGNQPGGSGGSTPAASKGSSGADTIDSNGNVTSPGSASKAGANGKNTAGTAQASAPQGSAPADDTDRPILKHRTAGSTESPTATSPVADEYKPAPDPNRPVLHRGVRPGDEASGSAPPLVPDTLTETTLHLQQMVAVSDATVREPHSFTYSWPDAQQPGAMQKQMEAMARKALADAAPSKPAPQPTSKQTATARRAAPTASKTRKTAAPADATPSAPALQDEKFNAYELSYEGGVTLALTAHTAGTGAQLRYVAVVAVVDIYGQPQLVLKSVTDAAHLDETPWMSLVDVVDADNSNRADLVFELHGAQQRQFALYRVARAASNQVLVTDPVP